MDFNQASSGQGLCQDARFLLGLNIADSVTYTVADLTRNINSWYRQFNSWIWQSSGVWEYDDSNLTDLPIATTDLVAAQADYSLPTVAQKVTRCEVMDSNGDYIKITPIDQSQIGDAMTEFEETDGMPRYYDIIGNSLFLYPSPASTSVTTSNGLKLWFSRDIHEFSTTDTSTEPGFNSNFHRGLSIGAALDYALAHDFPANTITSLNNQMAIVKESLTKFYGTRHNDMRPRIIPKVNNNY